jgi:hypothetical protein
MRVAGHHIVIINVRRVVRRPSIVCAPVTKGIVTCLLPSEINDFVFKHIDITPTEIIDNAKDSIIVSTIGTVLSHLI